MNRRVLIAFLAGALLGLWLHGEPATAQSPHGLFIQSSIGATLAQGSSTGVLTVTGQ